MTRSAVPGWRRDQKTLLMLAAMLLAGGLVYWGLDYARGYILIMIGDRVVQLSLWLTVLLLAVFGLGWYGLKLLWRGLTQPGLNAWRGRRGRREARNRRAVMVALADFYEGHWARARTALVQSAPRSEIPGLNFVLAADAATRLGQDTEAEELLAAAAREVPEDNAALALMRARLAVRRGDETRAVDQLRAALAAHADHPGLLAELRDSLLRQQDWEGLAGLLPGLRRVRVAPPEDLAALELQVYAGLLKGFSADAVGESLEQRHAALAELWAPHSAPKIPRRGECVALLRRGARQAWRSRHGGGGAAPASGSELGAGAGARLEPGGACHAAPASGDCGRLAASPRRVVATTAGLGAALSASGDLGQGAGLSGACVAHGRQAGNPGRTGGSIDRAGRPRRSGGLLSPRFTGRSGAGLLCGAKSG